MKTEAQRQWDCPEKQHTGGISLFTAQLISKGEEPLLTSAEYQ